MTKLLSAKKAKAITKENFDYELISATINWLNKAIDSAAQEGKSKIELSIALWSDVTRMEGARTKATLEQNGYKVEDFYCGIKGDHIRSLGSLSQDKMVVRISW